MTTTPFQPALPAPIPLTDQELNFIDDSPPGLFVENQNSNIGLLRKLFSDKIKEASDQITMIYTERFISTASQLLDQWEKEVGLPVNPSGLSVQQRRARIIARRRTGPFTRTRRQAVVEAYLQSTFGLTIQLVPAGVPFSAGGLPLYSDATSLTGLYTITENIPNFSYTVTINATAQIDQAGLLRELRSITPAHINFNIAYTSQPIQQNLQKSGGAISPHSGGGSVASTVTGTTTRSAIVTWAEFHTP